MRTRRRKNPSTLFWVALLAGAYGVWWLWRRQSLQSQATALNAKCVADRTLAQQALQGSPAQQATIRAKVEAAQGQAFLSDFEWQQWMRAQSTASCSAHVQ